MEIVGPVEDDLEYLLILDANNLLIKSDNEIDIIHHFVRMIDLFYEISRIRPTCSITNDLSANCSG
jgi:hypothetical protein